MLLTLVEAGAHQGWPQRVLHPFGEAGNSMMGGRMPSGVYEASQAKSWRDVPRTALWTVQRLHNFRPDIVHVHLFHALVLIAALPRSPGARLLLTHHHGSGYEFGGQKVRQAVDRVCVRRYDVVVAVSPAIQVLLEERYRLPRDRIRMITNGWGGNPRPRKPTPGKRVICVANLRPEKRHDVLIRAFAVATRQHPDAELILVGDGPLRMTLEGQVRELNLTERVTFTGAVADVWPLLAEADVFALSSQYETLGIAVLEAMAAGLPAVVTGVGGLLDVVEAGVTGLVVPAERPDEFAAALVQLLDSPAERLRMGGAAQAHAAGQRVEEMVERYLDLYRDLPAD